MRTRACLPNPFIAALERPLESAPPREVELSAADRCAFEYYIEQQRPVLLEQFLSRRVYRQILGPAQGRAAGTDTRE